MVAVYAQTGTLLLKALYDTETVGYYNLAVSISGYTNFVFLAIIDSMRPLILETKLEDEKKYRENMTLLYSIVMYLAIAQSVAICLLAKPVVPFLYGAEYTPAILPLQIIIWYSTFSYLGSVRNVWLLAEGKQKYLWMINLGGAIVNVSLNLILIPYWGVIGAAVTALVTQIFTNVIMSAILKPLRESNMFILRGLRPDNLKRFFHLIFRRIRRR
jgi:O-antigen/teichoic acid export membrane protein